MMVKQLKLLLCELDCIRRMLHVSSSALRRLIYSFRYWRYLINADTRNVARFNRARQLFWMFLAPKYFNPPSLRMFIGVNLDSFPVNKTVYCGWGETNPQISDSGFRVPITRNIYYWLELIFLYGEDDLELHRFYFFESLSSC